MKLMKRVLGLYDPPSDNDLEAPARGWEWELSAPDGANLQTRDR